MQYRSLIIIIYLFLFLLYPFSHSECHKYCVTCVTSGTLTEYHQTYWDFNRRKEEKERQTCRQNSCKTGYPFYVITFRTIPVFPAVVNSVFFHSVFGDFVCNVFVMHRPIWMWLFHSPRVRKSCRQDTDHMPEWPTLLCILESMYSSLYDLTLWLYMCWR